MQNRILKNESIMYMMAFILAAALRFIQLGTLPLGDLEAGWALQALHLTQGTQVLLGPQPIYVLPTAVLFFLFGATTFLARFIPAVTGSLLVLVPWLFRARLKPVPSLLLAFGLALDPALVSLSRQAGSLMPALTFTLLTWAFWWQRRPRAAGVTAGLALLSGSAVWMGALGLGLAWIFRPVMEIPPSPAKSSEQDVEYKAAKSEETSQPVKQVHWEQLKTTLLFGGATILLIGSMFFLVPNGLSAWLSSLPVFLGGWVRASEVSSGRMLLALLTYQPLALLFGLVAVIRGWWQGRRRYIRLSLWLLMALLLALFYPAHQTGDLAWALVPLYALAALEFSNHVRVPVSERAEVSGVAILVAVLLIFTWLDYAGIALDPANPINMLPNVVKLGDRVLFSKFPPTRYVLMFSVLLLLLVSLALVAMGWSERVARLGGAWGLGLVLTVYTVGVAWGATGLRTPTGWELWWPDEQPVQADLLRTTVNNLSEWSTGDPTTQQVTLLNVDSPALRWLLREHMLHSVDALDMTTSPAIVISPNGQELRLPATYRGQDFTWRQAPDWEMTGVYNWIHWSVFRDLPYNSETVVVWVRNDLFPDTHNSVP